MKRGLITLPFVLLLGAALYLSFSACKHAKAHEQTSHRVAKEFDLKGAAATKLEGLLETLSLGFVKNERRATIEALQKEANYHKSNAVHYAYYALAVSALVLLGYWLLAPRFFVALISVLAMGLLIFALTCPMLFITVQKHIEYIGMVILSHESKSVIGSVGALLHKGEYLVAVLIALFSVILPFVKLITLLLTALFLDTKLLAPPVKFFKWIGKWSMVDIFVVALFLVYFGLSGTGATDAKIGVAIYFFLGYMVVSGVASVVAQRLVQKGV